MRLSALLVLLVSACAPIDAPGLDAGHAARAAAIDLIASTIGAPGDRVTRDAAWLGTQAGWAVVRIPAFPAPGQPFHILAVMDGATSVPQSATLRVTTNDWGSFTDVPASGAARGGSIQRWGPYTAPAGLSARFAIRLTDNGADTWLNNNGTDHTVSIRTPEPITYVGDPVAVAGGAALPATGGTVTQGDTVALYASTFPQTPDTSVEVIWAVDGVRQPPAPMRIEFVDAGPFGNDTRWEFFLPSAPIAPASTVTWAFRARSTGPAVTLSDSGSPFSFTVAAPAP